MLAICCTNTFSKYLEPEQEGEEEGANVEAVGKCRIENWKFDNPPPRSNQNRGKIEIEAILKLLHLSDPY